MNLTQDLARIKTIFIDTAPIIYYIEANSQFGGLVREVIHALQSSHLIAFTSVITLTEVLPNPIKAGNIILAKRFVDFLKYGKNLSLLEISSDIAEKAGILRGKYPDLKTMDAIQISAAMDIGADAFLTNDLRLKRINEVNIIVLNDYLKEE